MNTGDLIVREAMKANPITVSADISVHHAAEIMKKHKIGSCIVIKKTPIGIVTERDILDKVVSADKKPSTIKVKEIMSSPLIIINPYVGLEDAMKIMSRCNIRRLPVIENKQLIGIISQKDISRLSPLLHEISQEWNEITKRDELFYQKQVFSGKCEDCGMLTTHLKTIDGRLLCEDCIDALNYE